MQAALSSGLFAVVPPLPLQIDTPMHSIILISGMLVAFHAPPVEDTGVILYTENFDLLTPPELPFGWTSSQNRSPGTSDFTTTASSPLSAPNALISTNATIDQYVVSPPVIFHEAIPESITFFTRRSSSHIATVVLEASPDDGKTFPFLLGDTLVNAGSADYVRAAAEIPETLALSPTVRFRWRVIGTTSGSTGTFRIDDIQISARVQDDLAVSRIALPPIPAGSSDPLNISIHITNQGLRPAHDFEAGLFLDENEDSVAAPGEQLASMFIPDTTHPEDSIAVEFSVPPLSPGTHLIIATVHSAQDSNAENDSLATQLRIPHPSGALVINEILFDPLTDEGEYLELFNTATDSIDLNGWVVRGRMGSSGTADEFIMSGIPHEISPGGFLLLAEDLSLLTFFPFLVDDKGLLLLVTGGSPSLNKDGDELVLCDPAGAVIDSVPYLPSWHHPDVIDVNGRSLEKINPALNGVDPRNWSTAAAPEGGTPGRQNSLYSGTPPTHSALTFSPNPFSPDGDGRDDMTIIRYEAPEGSSTISLQIFDIDGRLIRRLATNELTGPSGNIVWDGLDDQHRKARIGMYVVFLEIFGRNGEVIAVRKAVVVLAGKL